MHTSFRGARNRKVLPALSTIRRSDEYQALPNTCLCLRGASSQDLHEQRVLAPDIGPMQAVHERRSPLLKRSLRRAQPPDRVLLSNGIPCGCEFACLHHACLHKEVASLGTRDFANLGELRSLQRAAREGLPPRSGGAAAGRGSRKACFRPDPPQPLDLSLMGVTPPRLEPAWFPLGAALTTPGDPSPPTGCTSAPLRRWRSPRARLSGRTMVLLRFSSTTDIIVSCVSAVERGHVTGCLYSLYSAKWCE